MTQLATAKITPARNPEGSMPANRPRDLRNPDYSPQIPDSLSEAFAIFFWRQLVPGVAIVILVLDLIRMGVLAASGHVPGGLGLLEPWVM